MFNRLSCLKIAFRVLVTSRRQPFLESIPLRSSFSCFENDFLQALSSFPFNGLGTKTEFSMKEIIIEADSDVGYESRCRYLLCSIKTLGKLRIRERDGYKHEVENLRMYWLIEFE